MRLQRIVQGISLASFLALLWCGATRPVQVIPADIFLRMDPLLAGIAVMAGRAVIVTLLPAVLVLVLTPLLGRFFCSMVCPLGATIDMTDALLRGSRGGKPDAGAGLKLVKYGVLCFMAAASLLGVSWAAFGSPLAVATRFYGLLVHPALMLAADVGLATARPLLRGAGIDAFVYTELPRPVFGLQWVTALLMAGIAAGALFAPRFWCRCLCPAGALFGLVSRRPLVFRRRVSGRCTSCGACSAACPMDAIGTDPRTTDHAECTLCGRCSAVCPEDAIRYAPGPASPGRPAVVFSRHRRALMLSGLAGAGSAVAVLVGLKPYPSGDAPGQGAGLSLLRPPGALPETGFLQTCVGCGECMRACPTNTLQPAGIRAGLSGMFSPVMVPRLGPCDIGCTLCGRVCPTGALRRLDPQEKRYAKVGTAVIDRHVCIAWEQGKPCLVCDEVCPYGAVSLQRREGPGVSVPVVDEDRCNGCGFCEHYCPVGPVAAIVVRPMDALRLDTGSYREKGREMGLSLEPKTKTLPGGEEDPAGTDGALPPGFSD
ncbi:MAG TPA: 4Fe-4S binding protein [Deltaproteobacteria bacterium]|nr:4Fe-4S binding protein [Deltaproteobacteria bacterium]